MNIILRLAKERVEQLAQEKGLADDSAYCEHRRRAIDHLRAAQEMIDAGHHAGGGPQGMQLLHHLGHAEEDIVNMYGRLKNGRQRI